MLLALCYGRDNNRVQNCPHEMVIRRHFGRGFESHRLHLPIRRIVRLDVRICHMGQDLYDGRLYPIPETRIGWWGRQVSTEC